MINFFSAKENEEHLFLRVEADTLSEIRQTLKRISEINGVLESKIMYFKE